MRRPSEFSSGSSSAGGTPHEVIDLGRAIRTANERGDDEALEVLRAARDGEDERPDVDESVAPSSTTPSSRGTERPGQEAHVVQPRLG
jgi:hypothetical protein